MDNWKELMDNWPGAKEDWTFNKKAKKGKYPADELHINFGGHAQCLTLWCYEEEPDEEELANAKLIVTANKMLKFILEIQDGLSDKALSKKKKLGSWEVGVKMGCEQLLTEILK